MTFIKAWESDLSTPEETLPTVCTPTFTSSPKLLHFTLSGATVLAGRQETPPRRPSYRTGAPHPSGANLARSTSTKEGSEVCLEGLDLRPRAGSEAGATSLWYLGQVKSRWGAVRNLLNLMWTAPSPLARSRPHAPGRKSPINL